VALIAGATAGCGLGAGETERGTAELLITRDFGAEELERATLDDPPASETVMRLLDSEVEIETLYGGDFVDSIDGISGGTADGRRFDWFFYVNGVEANRSASDVAVEAGDRIWWDYRDWTAALRVPAVVGSFPEPFAHGVDGESRDVILICVRSSEACVSAEGALSEAGIEAETRTGLVAKPGDDEALRVLVGEWETLRGDPVARSLEEGPQTSGVYAIPWIGPDGAEIALLGPDGDEVASVADASGIVAATREGTEPPTWIVAGTDHAGTVAAAGLLDEATLSGRYALVVRAGDAAVPVPVAEEEG
jgi:hypothetical protein